MTESEGASGGCTGSMVMSRIHVGGHGSGVPRLQHYMHEHLHCLPITGSHEALDVTGMYSSTVLGFRRHHAPQVSQLLPCHWRAFTYPGNMYACGKKGCTHCLTKHRCVVTLHLRKMSSLVTVGGTPISKFSTAKHVFRHSEIRAVPRKLFCDFVM